jgi:YVTN family beta-propeller protein
VAQVDTNGTVAWFVEVGPADEAGAGVDSASKVGPRGLALNASAQTLYCLNRISNSISIIDTATKAVTGQIEVGPDPTPQAIKHGRGFLYDAKLSGNGTGACASCHVDGDMDKLAWNLGNPAGSMTSVVQKGQTLQFHPMKGPMTTQTLRGLLNLSPYHWRGDQANFAAFNPAFNELMGGPELSTADMTAYTNYANTILYLPNPYENLNRTPPSSLGGGNAVTGQTDFLTLALTSSVATCNACHTADPGPGSNRLIVNRSPQPMKDAQLRNIYQKLLFTNANPSSIDGFGLTHDGSNSTLQDFLSAQTFSPYTAAEKTDMISYMVSFDTGTAPTVGYTLTLTAATVAGSSLQGAWATLQSQAVAGNNDLIARGTIEGQIHGLLYQPSTNNYISDAGVVYTKAQLQAFILAGDTLSFMGVYPGTGTT